MSKSRLKTAATRYIIVPHIATLLGEQIPTLQRSAMSIENPMLKFLHSSGVLCVVVPHTAPLERKHRVG